MLALKMIALNVPLSQWRKFLADNRDTNGWHGGKNTEKMAAAIFSQLGHEEVQKLISQEFDTYPADLRLILRDLCNKGNGSNNVKKGVQRLDILMGGKLLRKDSDLFTFRRQDRMGRWISTTVNPAVAGATRKYGVIK